MPLTVTSAELIEWYAESKAALSTSLHPASETAMTRGPHQRSRLRLTYVSVGPPREDPQLPSVAVPPADSVERILIVVAHPDDCDFGCAGSTARWTSEGRQVSYCIVTDGDAGGSDRSVTRAEVAQLRRREQTAAAAAVGVTDIAFLGYPDGKVQPSIELRRDISRVIRQRKPQRVVTQSPERNYQRIFASHPDHLAAGEAALCAVYPDSRNPFAHMELLEQEGLEPHTVEEMYLMAMAQGDTVVDITDTIERKLEALHCHASQYDNWDELAKRIREWARLNAENNGLDDGRSAESFLRVPTT